MGKSRVKLASNMRRMLKYRNESQTNMAEELGIKRTTLASYVNGSTEPSLDTLISISIYFNMGVQVMVLNDLSSMEDKELDKVCDFFRRNKQTK